MATVSPRALNRTLLDRQHLLARTGATPAEMVGHLVGLQAQDTLPPYLSLAARLTTFDPYDVTRGLTDRSLVRFRSLRGTVHLVTADDALSLRGWVAPVDEREIRASQEVGAAREVDRDTFLETLRELLDGDPLPQQRLGAALAEQFPAHSPASLGQLARAAAPLVQVPPRGTWQGSGGVVYQYVDRWVGRPQTDPDVPGLVGRYLRALGPATAADVTAWSGVTRLGPILKGMADRGGLVRHQDERGRPVYDVPGGRIVDEDAPAPVRLLGTYDNLWLSHAARDRVTEPHKRRSWMGPNGGLAHTVFVDGMLEGLWRAEDGRVRLLDPFRTLTRAERTQLDDEVARVESLLAR